MGIIPSQVEDHEGTLVAGFSNRLGAETTLVAELWAIFLGLRLAWGLGLPKVILEYDSMEAIK